MTRIRDLMTGDIETVTPETSAQEAARFMLRRDTGSLPVTDGDKLLGIVTDRDLAVRGLAQGRGPDALVADLKSHAIVPPRADDGGSEDVRVGTKCVSLSKTWGGPDNEKKK